MLSSLKLGCLARTALYQAPSCTRLLSTSPLLPASALAQLRKKTGYSLSICKKALGESENDVAVAEKWLQEQAQALGLAKASKLQGRNTSQGLVGVRVQGGLAALVEVNCETDFVARNDKFVTLVEQIAETCLRSSAEGEGRREVGREDVGALQVEQGGSLSDLVALNIGQIGENLALGRATVMIAGEGEKLCGLCHPNTGEEGRQHGRFAALLKYTGDDSSLGVVRGVCQHIIGMAPTAVSNEEDRENSLFHQAYLLDEELKVSELLTKAGVEVKDFVRVEVGRSEE